MSAKLMTKAHRAQLAQNGIAQRQARDRGEYIDFPPVEKFFTLDAGVTWLLTKVYPADLDIAFGLCDLGVGLPELGDVSLAEIEAVRGPFGLHVERDMNFLPKKPLSAYAREAREVGPIIA